MPGSLPPPPRPRAGRRCRPRRCRAPGWRACRHRRRARRAAAGRSGGRRAGPARGGRAPGRCRADAGRGCRRRRWRAPRRRRGPSRRKPGTASRPAISSAHRRSSRSRMRGQSRPHHPVQRGGEPHGLGDRRRAGFEAPRRRGPGRWLDRDFGDHAAAAEERRQAGKQLAAPPEHADAAGAEALVAGEGVEIDAQRLHVLRPVLHRLRAVEQDLAPTARAAATTAATSVRAPVTLEHCVTATRRVRGVSSSRQAPGRVRPSALTGSSERDAARSRSICQGTKLLWCSACEISTRSPARSVAPKAWATRLSAAVAPEVNTISSAEWALRKRAALAAPTRRPGRPLRPGGRLPRMTLARLPVSWRNTASSATRWICAVAALSR
jgi:hypothetical protein